MVQNSAVDMWFCDFLPSKFNKSQWQSTALEEDEQTFASKSGDAKKLYIALIVVLAVAPCASICFLCFQFIKGKKRQKARESDVIGLGTPDHLGGELLCIRTVHCNLHSCRLARCFNRGKYRNCSEQKEEETIQKQCAGKGGKTSEQRG